MGLLTNNAYIMEALLKNTYTYGQSVIKNDQLISMSSLMSAMEDVNPPVIYDRAIYIVASIKEMKRIEKDFEITFDYESLTQQVNINGLVVIIALRKYIKKTKMYEIDLSKFNFTSLKQPNNQCK